MSTVSPVHTSTVSFQTRFASGSPSRPARRSAGTVNVERVVHRVVGVHLADQPQLDQIADSELPPDRVVPCPRGTSSSVSLEAVAGSSSSMSVAGAGATRRRGDEAAGRGSMKCSIPQRACGEHFRREMVVAPTRRGHASLSGGRRDRAPPAARHSSIAPRLSRAASEPREHPDIVDPGLPLAGRCGGIRSVPARRMRWRSSSVRSGTGFSIRCRPRGSGVSPSASGGW
jgi:hypothetical protein